MIDFLLGTYLAGLSVRGWLRGLVRELMDLVGLVAGIVVAFRASGPVGDYLNTTYGMSPETARLVAAGLLFLVVGAIAGILAHLLSRIMSLPGLNLANRLGGVGVALAWAIFLVLATTSLLRALPLPDSVDRAMGDSKVLDLIAGPSSPPQRLFHAMAGDKPLEALLALESLFGERRVLLEEDEQVAISLASPEDLVAANEDAALLLSLVNAERVSVGLAPLAWSDGLAKVAAGHAEELYTSGYVGHRSPTTGTVADRVRAAGIPYVVVAENLALASSARSVHAGLLDSPSHRANILAPDVDRIGIAALDGPVGLMVVEVFAG